MRSMNFIKLIYRTLALKISHIDSDPTSDYNQAAATYDNFYSRYLGQTSQALFDMLPLNSGMSIVDLACGTGFFSHQIAKKIGETGQLTAVDLSKGMLDQNRINADTKGLKNITFVESDAIQFLRSLENNSIDGLICGWGICYMNHERFRQEAERVVRPGGFIGIIENKSNTLKAVSDLFRKAMIHSPEALIKNMVINLPKNHQYLFKAFCKGAFQPISAWDGYLNIPCNEGKDIAEYMIKSGASAGFLNALDQGKVDQVMKSFIHEADIRFKTHKDVPVKHEYCALLAKKIWQPVPQTLTHSH